MKWKHLYKKFLVFNTGEENYYIFSKNGIFVDKTKLIIHLNDIIDKDIFKNICITRPRHFGKTITIDMLTAYYIYSESKITVFENKKICKINE